MTYITVYYDQHLDTICILEWPYFYNEAFEHRLIFDTNKTNIKSVRKSLRAWEYIFIGYL